MCVVLFFAFSAFSEMNFKNGECYNIFSSQKKEERDRWMSYEEARNLMKLENISSSAQFREWKSQPGRRPVNFPSDPSRIYKENWKSWKEFFGKEWMSYEEAKTFIQNEGIHLESEFRKWKKKGFRPSNFPAKPERVYKKYWNGWKEFFGKEWMSYEEAQDLMKLENISSFIQFREWRSQPGRRPVNFPSDPSRVYKENWKSWKIFLGAVKK